ncbi:effector-associated constant component EACC1 [Micromonospora arida]|uniref:effector-associated constant component EACC1 n=1 Tax=Micromonospora arida TaxID=2203715 RepID=UPI0033BBFB84
MIDVWNSMYLMLRPESDHPQDRIESQYESLHDWLATEPTLRPMVALKKRSPQHGELGGLTEALSIAVTPGGAITVLAGALGVWLARATNRGVRIEIRQQRNGTRTVLLNARNTKTEAIERMLRELTTGKQGDDGTSSR